MASPERIQQLRLLIGGLEDLPSREFLKAPQIPGGIPRGVLVELLGHRRTEWLVQFLKQHPDFLVFWAEQEQSLLPTALQQRGLDLRRITFATLGTQLAQPLRRVIQSQLYQVIIAPNHFADIKTYKAFQLLTEKAHSLFFLMGGKQPSQAWPISMQIEIEKGIETGPDTDFRIEIIKQKYTVMSSAEVTP